MRVLFVCTGNTCRSPMAMAVAKKMHPDWDVKSAGLFAAEGQGPAIHAHLALSDEGILLDHSATQLTLALLAWADRVYTMDAYQKEKVLQMDPAAAVQTLCESAVSDPFGGSLDEYKKTLQQITACIRRIQV